MTQLSTQVTQTMSSREIAELTDKTHANVMRDIREMLNQLSPSSDLISEFSGSYTNSRNQEHPCFHLPRRECEILVTGYNVVRRAAVIDRWLALEASPVVTGNPLLNALVESQRQQDALAVQVSEQATRIEEVSETTEVLREALRGIECPPGHYSAREVKEHFAPWLSETKVKAALTYWEWNFEYFTVPVPGGNFNRECKAYAAIDNSIHLHQAFQAIRQHSTQVSPQYYTHPAIPGRFQINV